MTTELFIVDFGFVIVDFGFVIAGHDPQSRT